MNSCQVQRHSQSEQSPILTRCPVAGISPPFSLITLPNAMKEYMSPALPQEYGMGFPKAADGKEYVAQQWFKALYAFDVIEEDAFEAWRDEDDDEERPGKIKLLTQTTEWFAWLEQAEEEDEDED